jgi:hypothetical protein
MSAAAKRIQAITGHLDVKVPAPSKALASEPTAALGKPGQKADNDIVIVSSVRTAIGRARRGGLKDTFIEDMLAATLKVITLRRHSLRWRCVSPSQTVVGCDRQDQRQSQACDGG